MGAETGEGIGQSLGLPWGIVDGIEQAILDDDDTTGPVLVISRRSENISNTIAHRRRHYPCARRLIGCMQTDCERDPKP